MAHVIPAKSYFNVLMVLFVLTVLTVLVARPVSGIDLGIFSDAIAFLIATVKATFVAAIFMGLKYQNKLHTVCLVSGVFFLLLLFLVSKIDIASRVLEQSTL